MTQTSLGVEIVKFQLKYFVWHLKYTTITTSHIPENIIMVFYSGPL